VVPAKRHLDGGSGNTNEPGDHRACQAPSPTSLSMNNPSADGVQADVDIEADLPMDGPFDVTFSCSIVRNS